MLLLLVLLAGGLLASSALEKPHYDVEKAEELYEAYIITYGKTYSSLAEKKARLELFKESLKRINQKNIEGNAVYNINHFSDLTPEEMSHYMGFVPSLEKSRCENLTDKDITTRDAPESLNWSAQGAVTPIKNQGPCGSCWAFACVGNIEGQYFLKNKNLESFSEQEFVDCSRSNRGCGGGIMAAALADIRDLGGVELESTYPYVVHEQPCRFDAGKVVAKIVGCKKYDLVDEEKLKELLAKKGPLIIGVNAARLTDYHKGIMTQKDCDDKDFMGHAVLLAGYGTENGVDYWLIKNSWGEVFGEKGYFRITRGDNTCQLLKYVATADL